MTEYQRFAAYVYEYRKGKKGQNCGFIKVEVKEGRCFLEIRLRCQGILPDTRCKVYGFVRRDGLLMGVLLGSIQSEEDRLEGSIETEASNMGGSGIPMSKMGGMILLTDTGAFYGTEWDDQPIRPANFQEMKPKEEPAARRRREEAEEPAEGKTTAAPEEETPEEKVPEEETPEEEIPEEKTPKEETPEEETPKEETLKEEIPEEETPEEEIPEEETPDEEMPDEETPEEVPEEEIPEEKVPEEALDEETPEEEVPEEEVPEDETLEEISGEEKSEEGITVQEVAEAPVEEMPVGETTAEMPKEERTGEERAPLPPVGTPCVPFPDCDFPWCGRLQVRELLQIFPRQRGLINNRFLQYGCHHFGHILLCRRQDGQYLLGVPGVYEQQEGFMARTFGFPYFKESPLVQTPRGRGGYWYRLLDAPDLHQGNRP